MMTTLAMLLALQGADGNWPQWRGPLGNGSSPTADPPTEWSATRNVAWKVEIPGKGSATPIVWGGKLFVLTAVDTGRKAPNAKAAPPVEEGRRGMSTGPPATLQRYEILCLDAADGKLAWRKSAVEELPHEGTHPTNNHAPASPSTDGKVLIVPFGSRGIFGYDLEGNQKWKKDLGDMKTRNGFGEGSSPALHGDAVVVIWDNETGSFIVCLDAASGEERWRVPRDEVSNWTTPVIVEHAGATQVIVNATKRVRSYDLKTGRLIWECGGQTGNVIPVPLVYKDAVICMSGFRANAIVAIRLDSKGDVTDKAGQAWKRTDAGPYVASPLLYDDRIYFTKERQGILYAADAATGANVFGPERIEGVEMVYSSVGGAGGKVYVTGREGTTFVYRHGPKAELLATNRLGEGVDASPVFVGKRLYLRGEKHLFALESR
jgi:outer membrane protein assembly factor BamB